ncbi:MULTISPECIES: hypothetical protein [Myxococcus]|uniref:hypothetical protein n=1 Tax=Myxococcus TaxID=32 RepID=UPI0013D3E424|nr:MULTISPECIES: hypothetical protein [Myxococcus]NVJ20753.1 hypothetical protein [Myxococcus sp. AM011]
MLTGPTYGDLLSQNANAYHPMRQREHNGGNLCFAFACRWAREILSADIWMKWSLKQTSAQRIGKILLDLPEVTKQHRDYQNQLDSDAHNVRQLQFSRHSAQLNRRIDSEEFEPGKDPDSLKINAITRGRFFDNGAWLTPTESKLALAFNLHLAGVGHWDLTPNSLPGLVTSFTDILSRVAKQTAYLLFFAEMNTTRAHAVGIYRSHGMAWQDWYVFDPNHGEFKYNSYTYGHAALLAIATQLGMDSVRLMQVSPHTSKVLEV